MHYFSFNIGDYAKHTSRLSPIEDLAYRRLIDLYYLNERALNGRSTDVAREIGLAEYSSEVEYVLTKFFEKDGDFWIHDRIEKEIETYHKKAKQASDAGKASVKARRIKARERALKSRSTVVEDSLNGSVTNHKPITNNQYRSKDIVENQNEVISIDIDIELDDLPIAENDEESFNDPNAYEAFLASEENTKDDKKAQRKKTREKKIADAQEAFSTFWDSGMRKAGDKKKALSKFVSLATERKQTPEAFADFLKTDIEKRISINQIGFDSLMPTTYLNGSRFEDDYQEQYKQHGAIANETSYPREFTNSLDGTENNAVIKIKYAQFERDRIKALNQENGSVLDQNGGSVF